MKYILIISIIVVNALLADAQTGGGGNSRAQTGKTTVNKSAAQQRGTGQYHGSKDTTPGSPMGTGGAGGNEMSGSPSGSAAKSAIPQQKADAPAGGAVGSQGVNAKKSGTKKKVSAQKDR